MKKIELNFYIKEIVTQRRLVAEMIRIYLPIIISIIGILIGFYQSKKQLNREMYEKGLSKVYASLIGIIAKQELFRKWSGVDIPFKDAQVVELFLETGTLIVGIRTLI